MRSLWVSFILAFVISNLVECNGQATKLCGDVHCSEMLFKTVCTRFYDSSHEGILKCEEGKNVQVYAISLSNRPDLVEAKTEDGWRGMVYMSHIDLEPFVFFLESALRQNQNFYVVAVDRQTTLKKVIGEKKANPHLIRLYKVYADKLQIPATDFEPIVSEEDKQKSSHGHGHSHGHEHSHAHSHGHSHEQPSETAAITRNDESQLNAKVAAADPVLESKVSADTPPNSAESDIKSSSVEETAKSVETLSKVELPATTKEADIQTNMAEYPAEAIPQPAAATAAPLSIDPIIPLEVAKIHETISNQIPSPDAVNQQADVIKQELVSSPSESSAKVAETAHQPPTEAAPIVAEYPAMPYTPAPNQQEQPPETTTPAPITQEQYTVPSTAPPVIQEQPSTHLPPVQIPVTPPTMPPAGNFLHREVLSPDNSAEVGSQEKQMGASFPGPTPTIQPATSTFPPGGRTASSQVHDVMGGIIQELVGQVEEIKELPKVEEKVTQPTVPPALKSEEMETVKDIGMQKTISQMVAEGIPPAAAKVESETTNVGGVPTEQLVSQQAGVSPPVEQVLTEQKKKEEFVPQDPLHQTVKEEQQPIAKEPLGETFMKAEGIEKTKESYCHKEDCGNYENLAVSSNSSNLLAARSVLREFVDPLREVLPYPLSQFDLTGIFVLVFVLISLVLHLINMCFFYETGRDVVDQKLLHDCMTRLKEQELALKKYQADSVHYQTIGQKLARAGAAAEQLHQEKQKLELEFNALRKEYSDLYHKHEELSRLHEKDERELEVKTREVADALATLKQKDAEIEQLTGNLQIIESRNEVAANELTAAKKKLEQQRHESDALLSTFKDSQLDVERLSHKWQCSEDELSRQRSRNEELQTQVDEFINIIRELKLSQQQQSVSSSRKSTPPSMSHTQQGADLDNSLEQDENGGSNGSRSGGWSDLGDDTPGNEDEDDTTMSSRTGARVGKSSSSSSKTMGKRNLLSSDLLELAHLKGELRKTEAERDTLRFSLENEQKEKEGLSQRLEQLKQDLTEKRKEAERRESERHDLQSQCTKLLHMVDERDRKVEHIEEDREKLRAKISQVEADWRQTEDDKRELAIKVKDLEQSLRRSEELNSKLENKIYHEERRLNAKIRMLEERVNKTQSSVSPHNSGLGDLNMSGNSSDREFNHRVPLEVPSLWSDVEGPEMQFENVLYDMNRRPGGGAGSSLRQRNGGQQQRNSPALSNNNRNHGSSPFELEQIFANKSNGNGSTMNPKEKRAPRTRSRSTGRNSARLVGVDPGFNIDVKRSLIQK